MQRYKKIGTVTAEEAGKWLAGKKAGEFILLDEAGRYGAPLRFQWRSRRTPSTSKSRC